MEKQVCGFCFEFIEGGTYIEKEGKKIYFCSNDCLEKFENEQS
jgi:ribosomal protein L24E